MSGDVPFPPAPVHSQRRCGEVGPGGDAMKEGSVSGFDITYEDIHNLLISLGFAWELRIPKRRATGQSPRETVMYRHGKTGMVLFFPSKEAQRTLDGDLVSLRMHLVGRGHLGEADFDNFLRCGKAKGDGGLYMAF